MAAQALVNAERNGNAERRTEKRGIRFWAGWLFRLLLAAAALVNAERNGNAEPFSSLRAGSERRTERQCKTGALNPCQVLKYVDKKRAHKLDYGKLATGLKP